MLQEDYLSNGLTINHLGNVVAARHFDGTITGVENARIFASQFQGARFNSPNDLDKLDAGYDLSSEWMYFKLGAYTQNNTGNKSDGDIITFYRLENTHDKN